MNRSVRASRESEDRVPVGIESFDDLIEGGIPRGSLVLLAGNTGSGKTTFSAKYLHHGASNVNEPGVYVSFAENRETFLRNMKRMNMDFQKQEQEGRFRLMDFATVKEKGIEYTLESILAEIQSLKAKRLVIDSFSAMAQALKEPIETRIVVHTILGKMVRQLGCTTLLLVEIPEGVRRIGLGIEEFVSDGVVSLTVSTRRGYLDRKLQVIKMRGTRINKESVSYDIDDKGIRIYPPPKMEPLQKAFVERVSTGIEGLDRIISGGLPKGSATMIVGASGTGKTAAALHFIVEGTKQNERGLFLSFEEPEARLMQHGESFGWPMMKLVKEGLINFLSLHCEPQNIQKQFLQVRTLLQQYKPARFVIDSLTPLERTMEENEYLDRIKRWNSSLAANGVTVIFTATSDQTGPTTCTGISTLVDNIIFLRDVELESTLKRSLTVFKARGTAHDRDIREFEITSKGIVVKEKFAGVEQILGGAARRSMTEEAARTWGQAFGGKR